MFTIADPTAKGCHRRDFLKVGTLGLGGLPFASLLGAQAAETKSVVTGKSVIFLHMHGGPSQTETFDPKMTAPEGIRSTTGEVQTALPGITFGATFAKLAKLADKLAVVRSYVPAYDHSASPLVNAETLKANLGSYYARVNGLNHPTTGIPSTMLLAPQSVHPNAESLAGPGAKDFTATGPLGSAYAPFSPGSSGTLQQNMQLRIPRDRLDDRRQLLAGLDNLKRELDTSGTMDAMHRYQGQAIDLVLRGVAEAFDLAKEDPRTIARYDTAPLVRLDAIRKNLGNYKYYVDHARSVGKLLLLARRLCEAGCGFVSVVTNFVWDMHADGNNAPPKEAMPYVGLPFDHAVATLIEDLEARGLRDKVLLVCCGEMGRSPRINKGGGRDHWGNLGPLLFYGGGLKMGQVIGRSAADGGTPASDSVRIPNLMATIFHTLFDVGEVRVMRGLSGDVARLLTEGEPIRQLMP
ncbi:MAG: DUF1501 domain-containing protein [Planctomycetia bacterium]|nr:DUF1501 domain-containing protein [Planctomycetia bacterium]